MAEGRHEGPVGGDGPGFNGAVGGEAESGGNLHDKLLVRGHLSQGHLGNY